MTRCRLCYLAVLAAALVFYIAYGEWLAWILLLTLLILPWLSLVISLPAMLSFHAQIGGPYALQQGTQADVWMIGASRYPLPPFRGKLHLQCIFTGERRVFRSAATLPNIHCGGYTAALERVRVCDYLGLFAFPFPNPPKRTILVRPRSLPLPEPPDLHDQLPRSWRPKPGGGFAENHELRLYRPGDSLNQIHWKLTAKTGKLTIREPMQPQQGLLLLTMTLRGTAEELDRKFGRLLWLGLYLLRAGLSFHIRVLTGDGITSLAVSSKGELGRAIDTLLCTPPAREGSIRDQAYAASWQYHIGGDPDES